MLKLLLSSMFMFFISIGVSGKTVTDVIEQVHSGYLTSPEYEALFLELERGMPYADVLDNVQVQVLKCWFASPHTDLELSLFKSYLQQAYAAVLAAHSEKLKFELQICEAFITHLNGDSNQALEALNSVLIHTDNVPALIEERALANLILSRIYMQQRQYENAVETTTQAYKLFELSGNDYQKALALRDIALIHAELKNFSLAIEQMERAIVELKVFNEQEWYMATNDLAEVYELAGQSEQALELYQNIKDMVLRYEDDNGQSYVLLKIAQLHIKSGDVDSAQLLLDQVRTLQLSDERKKSMLLLTETEWALATGDILQAEKYYKLLDHLDKDNWSVNRIERFVQIKNMLAVKLNDSVLEAEALRELLDLSEKRLPDIANSKLLSQRLTFDLEQRGKEIIKLRELNEVKERLLAEADAKVFWQLFSLVFVIVLLISMGILAYKQTVHKQRFRTLALKDELTGVANRRAILKFKQEVLEQSKKLQRNCALISIDIDFFKFVNDTYGHDVGDELIVSIVNIVSEKIRKSDCVGRLGGEEFLIVLPQTIIEEASEIAERIRSAIDSTTHTNKKIKATVSMGVIQVAMDETFKSAGQRVDQNLYLAKNDGKNKVVAV
ncbi:diguanylate cyclase [Paraglaciecola hydrolytica]|uniref:diguanylate cyclase n=1 Tax=Paraglaciecola hydrolytica TaxID=1799789 RepID=A0A136A648_9ALTE|nr:diguanylate cyclase [Paraglaciecola hydrolytica]KXI30707.1 hypothetical protein AX660_04585 [Paraglaciecola hydrolytica]